MVLKSISYKPHQSLDYRNILLHFGRPKHLSVLFWSWKKTENTKFFLYEENLFKTHLNRMIIPTAGSAWSCIILPSSDDHCPWGTVVPLFHCTDAVVSCCTHIKPSAVSPLYLSPSVRVLCYSAFHTCSALQLRRRKAATFSGTDALFWTPW